MAQKIITITFGAQPNNDDIIGFDADFAGVPATYGYPFKTVAGGVGEIQIGATLEDTIVNTRDVIESDLNNTDITFTIEDNVLTIIIEDSTVTIDNLVDAPPRVLLTTETVEIPAKIWTRSPYFITIDETNQDGSKIELFFWNKGQTEPLNSDYTQSKKKVSNTQTANNYNISNFAAEFLNIIRPVGVTSASEEDVNTWAFLKVKTYTLTGEDYTLLSSDLFVCFNGYTSFTDGYNVDSFENVILLSDNSIRRYQSSDNSHYVNVWLAAGDYTWNGDNFTVASDTVYKLPLVNGINTFSDAVEVKFTMTVENTCEPIYTPVVCSFMNRFGGWEFITLFKNSTNSFETESKEYNLMPNDVNYNIYRGQKRTFNHKKKQKVKTNTGWVDQNFSELLQDLQNSEVILLDNKPALMITKNFEEKSHIRDSNINYELEFEYAFNLINDVI